MQLLTVGSEDGGKRVDVYLAQALGLSRSQAALLIKHGQVTKNGKLISKASSKVSPEEQFTIDNSQKAPEEVWPPPEFPSVEVLQDTDDYVVLNKPSGLLVHETEAKESLTLVTWLLEKYPHIQGVGEDPTRPGIVHRLDKDASGVLIVAKNQKMFKALKQQFKNRTIIKEYQVLVHGNIEADEGKIDFLIDRGSDGRMVARPRVDTLRLSSVAQAQEGKEALTEFFVLRRFINYSLLSVRIHTGRTHQIRVHFYAFNHPVVGDTIYFQKKLEKFNKGIGRLFLHSQRIVFQNFSDEKVEVVAPLPEKLEEFLKKIK